MNGTAIRNVGSEDNSRSAQIANLRTRMEALGGGTPEFTTPDSDILPVGSEFHNILPGGGVPRQAVTGVSDFPALIVEMLDAVTAAGGFAGVVGWPELSYASVYSLEQIIAVPEPGIDPLSVAGVLVEGLDLVVLRTAQKIALSPVRARPLLARVRRGRAALLMVNATVHSPALTITGRIDAFHGIGHGEGRITGMDIRVEAAGHRASSAVVTIGQGVSRPGLRAVN